MATVQLYSVAEGREVEHKLSVDPAGEIIAETAQGEVLKFPANLSKVQLEKLFREHNQANEGLVARTDADFKEEENRVKKSQSLIDKF